MTEAISCSTIAKMTKAELVGDGQCLISHVGDLESAGPTDITFFANIRYKKAFLATQAGAVFCTKEALPKDSHSNRCYLIVENPSLAFQQLINYFHPHAGVFTGFSGIHPTALIHPTAKIGPGVQIGPYAVIDQEVEIGAHTKILSHVVIGPYSVIGENCLLFPHSTVREESRLGNRVIVQPGAVIGSCGFGYTQTAEGHHQKLSQVGNVVLEDDVEIGANTTIDRARFGTTLIKRGAKIDNLVQLAHGVEVGEDCLIIALSGVAGSSKLGRHCILAAQSGVAGHLTLEDGVTIAAKAGVSKSLKKGVYNGAPAMPIEEYNRTQVYIRKLPELFKKNSG